MYSDRFSSWNLLFVKTRVQINKLWVASKLVASLSHYKLQANKVGSWEPMNQQVIKLKTPWEEKESGNFWPVINSKQWLFLYSHQSDKVLSEWHLLQWKKNVEIPVDQLDKIQKMNCFSIRSVTHNMEDELTYIDEKRWR